MKGGSHHDNAENGVTRDAPVLMELVLPWVNTHRIVCADSYFSSIAAAELLYLKRVEVYRSF